MAGPVSRIITTGLASIAGTIVIAAAKADGLPILGLDGIEELVEGFLHGRGGLGGLPRRGAREQEQQDDEPCEREPW